MIVSRTFEEQLAEVDRAEPRILIVGAGIAGVALAQLLRAQGRHPVLIERSPEPAWMTDDDHAGYMLALMPMVDPIITRLGLWDEYRERSVEIDRFSFHSRTGAIIRSDRLGHLLAVYGDYRGIARGELIATLAADDCPVTVNTSVTSLVEDQCARITLDLNVTGGEPGDGGREAREAEFDLVVIADGLRSRTREFVPGGQGVEFVDTGWGGWIAWASADADGSQGSEVWGDGFFLGSYPVKDRIGIFLGGPDTMQAMGHRRFAQAVSRKLRRPTPRIEASLSAIAEAEDPYFWSLRDCRTSRWATDHTVLLGDAAAGFLPTAGIGAGMAMESAWMLGRALTSANRNDLGARLREFETRQRPRVERAQDASRHLAAMMFHDSKMLGALRDQIFRMLSVRVALKPIVTLLEDRAS